MNGHQTQWAGVDELGRHLSDGRLSAVELLEHCLERIARLDHQLRAFRTVMIDSARAQAREADLRRAAGERGCLLGIPIAVKDDIDVQGASTMWGTSIDPGPATADAEVVRRLRAAGAVIIGKTAMPELAMWSLTESSTWGITRNPWDLSKSPGGSSGGAAAAVAAGLVPAAIGSDGGGSTRMPAAACGLFALKAQRGRVSIAPDPERWHGLLHIGPLTRSVKDSALIYDVITGNVPGDATVPPPLRTRFADALLAPPAPLRIAVSYATPLPVRTYPSARAPVARTVELLRGLGHHVTEADPPYGLGALAAAPRFGAGTSELVARLPDHHLLERRTRQAAWAGQLVPRTAIRWSKRAEQRRYVPRINAFFDDYDLLLTPVMAQGALQAGAWRGYGLLRSLGAMTAYASHTPAWNLTGQPAASIPTGLDQDGVPTAAQLIAPQNGELALLALAAQLERARPWIHHRPTLASR